MKKQTKVLLAAVAGIVLLAAVFFAMYQSFLPSAAAGEKQLILTVVHKDGAQADFTLDTQAEYLGDVLTEENLIQGEESAYGLYVTKVDGETADESKEEWWCLTKDGETCDTGISQTPISDGDHFELTLTTGW